MFASHAHAAPRPPHAHPTPPARPVGRRALHIAALLGGTAIALVGGLHGAIFILAGGTAGAGLGLLASAADELRADEQRALATLHRALHTTEQPPPG